MTALVVVGGRPLRGPVRVPGDKSISHRALLLGALAEGTSVVRGRSPGDDVGRTEAAVRALGAAVEGERVTGGAGRLHEPAHVIDLGNSGTSMRLLAGLCAGFDWLTVLAGDASLSARPMDRVAEPLREMGAHVDGRQRGRLPPLAVRGGRLKGIDYRLPVASAQVKSAVLLAGLGAEGETVVREPVPTRAHTEELLARCGADVETGPDPCTVRLRPSRLQPFELDVPGDPSQAAYWLAAACLVPGSDLVVEDVELSPARTGFLGVLERMGARVTREGDAHVRARYSPGLHGTSVGGDEVPSLIDEVPVLAVVAAVAEGETVFRDLAELRVKESDRIATLAAELPLIGARVDALDDGLVVTGPCRLRGTTVRSHGDHRVAMALAVAGVLAKGVTEIEGAETASVSYPGFWDHLELLCSA
jgi:3-phosphoshikimate 1-carboxyvinyltransferase